MNKIEFSPKVKPPVTRNDRIDIQCNSIQIQNAGNVVARIDDEWTLAPGGILTIGSHTDYNIIIHELHVAFVSDPLGQWISPGGAGAVQRIEIIENHIHNDPQGSHYVEKAR